MTSDNTRKLQVLVSSPVLGLKEHRNAAITAILEFGMYPLAMEYLSSMDNTPRAYSLKLVEDADIYVGFLAHRYGDCPPDADTSYTELEYRRAVERNIPKLIFLMDKSHPVLLDHIDLDPANREKLVRFKAELEAHKYVIETFTTPENLHLKIFKALKSLYEDLAQHPNPWSAPWLAKGDLDPSTEHAESLDAIERELAELQLDYDCILRFYRESLPPNFVIPQGWEFERGMSDRATLHRALRRLNDARPLPGKVAPVLEFAERAAAEAAEEGRQAIHACTDQIASKWEVTPSALRTLRHTLDQASAHPAKARHLASVAPSVYLLVELDQVNGDTGKFLAQAWLFCGEDEQECLYETNQPRSFDTLPTLLKLLLTKVARHRRVDPAASERLVIEFSVPYDFFFSDFDGIVIDNVAVGLEYRVVLRSLERLRNITWHGRWKAKWARVRQIGLHTDINYVKWLDVRQSAYPEALYAELVHEDMLCVGFTGTSMRSASHRDTLHMALRSGTPIMLWPCQITENPAIASEIAATVQSLLSPQVLSDLPYQLLCARRADTQQAGSYHASRRLTLLWDDPTHIPPDLEEESMLEIPDVER